MTSHDKLIADLYIMIVCVGPKLLLLFALSAIAAPLFDRLIVRRIERRRCR